MTNSSGRYSGRRRRPAACAAGALAALLLVSPLRAQEDVVDQSSVRQFRVDVNLVTLRFTVRDAQGRFVNDLSADDFRVFENGSPRKLTFFEGPSAQGGRSGALWLAFLIDVSGSTFATRAEEILAARSFFDNIHAVTQVGIFGFTERLIPFYEFSPDKQGALTAFGSARSHLGKTSLYASLDTLIERMRGLAGPSVEKAIIVVSDGLDDDYRRAAASARLASDNSVRLYTIWVPSAAQLAIRPTTLDGAVEQTPERVRLDARQQAQEEAYATLSNDTGGRHFGGFETILNFDEVLAEINDEVFGNLYSMAYRTPSPLLDRLQRNVEIRLGRPGVEIHGLFQKVPERVRVKKSLIEALFDNEALSNLGRSTTSFREIGAQLDVLTPRREGDDVRLPFRLKIRGSSRTQFGIIGLLLDDSGRAVARLREVFRARSDDKSREPGQSIVYTNTLVAPAGRYVLRLAVVEIPSWRTTVFERPVKLGR